MFTCTVCSIRIHVTTLLEYILTALLEYINHLNKFLKRARVPPAHPSLSNESNAINCCGVQTNVTGGFLKPLETPSRGYLFMCYIIQCILKGYALLQ